MEEQTVSTSFKDPRIALAHDYLLVMRGAERSFLAIAEQWPQAPIATLLYDVDGTHHAFAGREMHVSSLQRLKVAQGDFRRLLPLFPLAASHLSMPDADVLLSSSSAFAHGIRIHSEAAHICYCYTPFRYAWHEHDRALEEAPRLLRPLLAGTLAGIRRWDRRAAERIDHVIAISELSRERIWQAWRRESSIVHPPVEVERFVPGTPEDFFLVVCELVRHKQVEVALTAARQAGRQIKVVGGGPDLRRLQTLYPEAEFLGRIDDKRLAHVHARARALVVPNIEEFGITAVEAQAAGRPVLASNAGGVTETVVDGETGILVRPGSVEAFAEAMRDVDFDRFEPQRMITHAARFSKERFQREMAEEVQRVIDDKSG
jgi:glycosyltransferase involved in cell wall biosynthesis